VGLHDCLAGISEGTLKGKEEGLLLSISEGDTLDGVPLGSDDGVVLDDFPLGTPSDGKAS